MAGNFYATTGEAARIQRMQINDLFANPAIRQVYIEFDEDKEELSGWYMLGDLDTSILASVFNAYPFTMSVTRLYSSGAGVGQVWESRPLENVYTTIPKPWLALPPNKGGTSGSRFQLRQGDGGNAPVWRDLQEGEMPISYRHDMDPFAPNSSDDKYYDNRCYVYDTITETGVINSVDPPKDDWIERFAGNVGYEGSVVIGNGFIRYVWSKSTEAGFFYLWTGNNWDRIIAGPDLKFTGSGTGDGLLVHRPVVTYFDWNKVVWYHLSTQAEERAGILRCELLRGSYYISMAVKADYGEVNASSQIDNAGSTTVGSSFENMTTSNYRGWDLTTAGARTVKYGMFFTRQATTSSSAGRVILGSNTPEGEWNNFGVFMLNNPTGISSLDVETLAQDYLSGMDFTERIVNFRELI